jgi:ATP-dependent helicase/nuclease subunit A
VRVWRADPWSDAGSQAAGAPIGEPLPVPDLATLTACLAKPTPAPQIIAPLRPSRAHADMQADPACWPQQAQAERHARTVESLGEADQSQALVFGTLVHRLLEPAHLPSPKQAHTIAQSIDPGIDQALVSDALEQARAVHGMEEAPVLFGERARAEVPLRGLLVDAKGNARQIGGTIDRLVVLEGEVWAVDFKTNAIVPDVSRLRDDRLDYIAQLTLYSGLLSRLFPDQSVRCGLLWTGAPRLDWISAQDKRFAAQSLGLPTAFSKP